MKITTLVLILFYSNLGISQKQIDNQFNVWINYSGNHKVSEKFSIHTLYSWRRNEFVKNWQQSLLRTGINYHFSDKLTLTPGYDWVVTFPYGKQPIVKQSTEHRIFEQFQLKNNIGSLSIGHRYRFEQRFIDKNSLKNRFRYRLTLSIPLDKKISLTIFDELFINYGLTNGHYFDQNWAYIGFGYAINKNSKINLGYMNQFILKSDNYNAENNHTISLHYKHNFSFNKKTK